MTATTLQKAAGYTIPAPSSAHWQITNSPTIGQAQGLTMRFFIISKTTLKLSGTILSWWRQEKGFLQKYRIMLQSPWNWKQKMRFIQPWLCTGFWPITRGKFLFPTESLWSSSRSSWFSYNNEIELSAVVNLVYLTARDTYRVEREDKAGEGYVDFIFYPERKDMAAILLELKIDHTPEEAIQQIKDRNYALRFSGKLGEDPKFTGKILAVGIGYSRKTKLHACRVEVLWHDLRYSTLEKGDSKPKLKCFTSKL